MAPTDSILYTTTSSTSTSIGVEGDLYTDSNGDMYRYTGGSWRMIGADYGSVTSTGQSVTLEVPVREIEDSFEIDEDTQKEVDKIGTPGKRDIHDLLKSFKVIKNPLLKKSAVEQLEDVSWVADTFESSGDEEPIPDVGGFDTFIGT